MSSKKKPTPAAKKPGTPKAPKQPKATTAEASPTDAVIAVVTAPAPVAAENGALAEPKPKKKAKAKAEPVANDPQVAPGERSLYALAEAYCGALDEQGKSSTTITGYRGELRLAELFLGENTPVASITPEQVQKFFESDRVTRTRAGLPKDKLSVDKTRRVLRLALVWAADQRWIEKAPLPEPKA